MRGVVQKVTRARVTVDGETVGQIGMGYMVLVGVEEGDGREDMLYMAQKISGLRVFEDAEDKMNLSLADVGGSCLLVSQFTLLADARKGRRPNFVRAARPEAAEPLFTELVETLRSEGLMVETGRFRTHMAIEMVNDGPVTILLDSRKMF